MHFDKNDSSLAKSTQNMRFAINQVDKGGVRPKSNLLAYSQGQKFIL